MYDFGKCVCINTFKSLSVTFYYLKIFNNNVDISICSVLLNVSLTALHEMTMGPLGQPCLIPKVPHFSGTSAPAISITEPLQVHVHNAL
jgi:hypothetical protein